MELDCTWQNIFNLKKGFMKTIYRLWPNNSTFFVPPPLIMSWELKILQLIVVFFFLSKTMAKVTNRPTEETKKLLKESTMRTTKINRFISTINLRKVRYKPFITNNQIFNRVFNGWRGQQISPDTSDISSNGCPIRILAWLPEMPLRRTCKEASWKIRSGTLNWWRQVKSCENPKGFELWMNEFRSGEWDISHECLCLI